MNPFDPIEIPPGRLLLQSVRSHDQYNTTIYGLDDRYRGVKGGRRVLFCDPSDLDELGLADGQIVDVVSEWSDDVERQAEGFRLVAYPVARSTCTAYFPEANVLVPLDSTADGSTNPRRSRSSCDWSQEPPDEAGEEDHPTTALPPFGGSRVPSACLALGHCRERLVMEDMRSVEVPPVPPRRLLAHHPRRGRAGRLALLRE